MHQSKWNVYNSYQEMVKKRENKETACFSPSKLYKRDKGTVPILSSAPFRHKIHAKPTKDPFVKKTTPEKH